MFPTACGQKNLPAFEPRISSAMPRTCSVHVTVVVQQSLTIILNTVQGTASHPRIRYATATDVRDFLSQSTALRHIRITCHFIQ